MIEVEEKNMYTGGIYRIRNKHGADSDKQEDC